MLLASLRCGLNRVELQEDVQVVPEDAEREDGDGERIASIARIAAEELGNDLVVVFCVPLDVCSYCLRVRSAAIQARPRWSAGL